LSALAQRIGEMRAAIAAAAVAAGRDPATVEMLAVCKNQPMQQVEAAYDAGLRLFAANRAQTLDDQATALVASGRSAARWHFIGPLQRNKAATVVRHAEQIHSVDRLALGQTLARQARAINKVQAILLQVKLGDEPQKAGVDMAAAAALATKLAALPGLRLVGLMGGPPPADVDPTAWFESLAQLRNRMQKDGHALPQLCMGMSADFASAIGCGATCIRLGGALFGRLDTGTSNGHVWRMNQDHTDGAFDILKGKAKKLWGELTDDDMLKAEGSVEKLYGIIQTKFGDTKDSILDKIKQFKM
jgi:pyridoxal phosphate enzyme (YggS family)